MPVLSSDLVGVLLEACRVVIYCKLLKLQANVEELNQSQCMGTSILIGLVILLLPGTLTI